MFIKQEMPYEYSYSYIKNNFLNEDEELICARIGATNYAIKIPKTLKNIEPIIVVDEKVPRPMWRQAMDLSMGRISSEYDIDRRSYRVSWMKKERINESMRFSVYKFVCR